MASCGTIVLMSTPAKPADQGVRARNRARMEAGILRLGREQLATRGPAALSLREIARDLGVASSAVYRYVADRDALLTRLLVDAYSDLAEHVESALVDGPRHGAAARVGVFAHAMRDWARANPSRWGLVYGTPVPGYAAPEEQTTPAGTRIMAVLVGIVTADRPDDARPTASARSAAYEGYLEAGAADLRVEASAEDVAAAVHAWSMIVGTISMEVFGQLGPEAAYVGAEIMDGAVATLARGLDLR